MKVNVEIDCTPEEARAFMGLPDLQPLHELYIARMASVMTDGVSAADVERLMTSWLGAGTGGIGEMQRAMWSAMTGGAVKG